MRILWLTVDRSRKVLRFWEELRRDCIDAAGRRGWTIDVQERPETGLIMWRKWADAVQRDPSSGPPTCDVQTLNTYDAIFTDSPFAYTTEPWQDVHTPRAALFGDMQGAQVAWYLRAMEQGGFDLWASYRDPFHKLHPDSPLAVWFPVAASPRIFAPEHMTVWKERARMVLMTGARGGGIYCHRQSIHDALQGHSQYTEIRRPEERQANSWPRGVDYAKQLGAYKVSIATGSRLGYVVTKYPEIPAMGTAMMATHVPEIDDLGFQPWRHYIPIDVPVQTDAVREQVDYWLRNDDGLRFVAEQGCQLVRHWHMTTHRAEYWCDCMKAMANDA